MSANDQRPVRRYFESVRTILEIAAISAAGVWLIVTFGLVDRPSFEPRYEITSSLHLYRDGDLCLMDFTVNFRNAGTGTIRIEGSDRASIQYVLTDKTWEDSGRGQSGVVGVKDVVSPKDYSPGPDWPNVGKIPLEGLATIYAPGQSDSVTYTFALEDWAGKVFAVRADFPSISNGAILWFKRAHPWWTSAWARPCDEENAETGGGATGPQ